MLLNTEDDPLVPAELLDPAYKFACKSQVNVCVIGHLSPQQAPHIRQS